MKTFQNMALTNSKPLLDKCDRGVGSYGQQRIS